MFLKSLRADRDSSLPRSSLMASPDASKLGMNIAIHAYAATQIHSIIADDADPAVTKELEQLGVRVVITV